MTEMTVMLLLLAIRQQKNEVRYITVTWAKVYTADKVRKKAQICYQST
jgi:hypothetical protein